MGWGAVDPGWGSFRPPPPDGFQVAPSTVIHRRLRHVLRESTCWTGPRPGREHPWRGRPGHLDCTWGSSHGGCAPRDEAKSENVSARNGWCRIKDASTPLRNRQQGLHAQKFPAPHLRFDRKIYNAKITGNFVGVACTSCAPEFWQYPKTCAPLGKRTACLKSTIQKNSSEIGPVNFS